MLSTFSSLKLSHKPGEWDGTFVLTATFLINDLLSDGTPFGAKLTGVTEDGTGEFYSEPVTIVDVTSDGVILTDDRRRFSVDNLAQIEIG